MVGERAITAKCRLEATRFTADADAEIVVPHSLGVTSLKKTPSLRSKSMESSFWGA
jgi:hypothetical protein